MIVGRLTIIGIASAWLSTRAHRISPAGRAWAWGMDGETPGSALGLRTQTRAL